MQFGTDDQVASTGYQPAQPLGMMTVTLLENDSGDTKVGLRLNSSGE